MPRLRPGNARHRAATPRAAARARTASRAQPAASAQASAGGMTSGTGAETIPSQMAKSQRAKSTRDGSSDGFAAEGTHSSQILAPRPRLKEWKAWTRRALSGTPE